MEVKILTLFPKIFEGFSKESLIGKAQEKGKLNIRIFNLRNWAKDKHDKVDDTPYGGGSGMVLKADVIDEALNELQTEDSKLVLLSPQGKKLNQKLAQDLSKEKELILICGRYEGFDERVRKLVDMELSIGDYILNGGEVAAMAVVETVSRLVPGVISKKNSLKEESFSKKDSRLLDYPEYTKPRSFKPKSKDLPKLKVPKVLLSGDHKKIKKWRGKKAREKSDK